MKILLKRHNLRINVKKLLAETCDIARKFKLLEQFRVSVEKKLLEPETAIVSDSIG